MVVLRNVSPPWAIRNNSLRGWCWMIIGMLIISVSMIVLILILRALKHNSKNCEFNLEINIKGFKLYFKTKEKNAPSNPKR